MAALPGTVTAAKKIDSIFHGLQFGLQSYVFTTPGLPRDGVLDAVVKSMVESQLGECDLFAPLVEPGPIRERIRSGGSEAAQARDELAKWYMSVSLDYFKPIRKKFEDAGIRIYGLSAFPGSTEEELNRTFEIAKVLGARLITLGITLSAAKRIAPLVEKSNFQVGLQGHPDLAIIDPDVIAKPENFEEAVSLSKNYRISFDSGDATGGGYDALRFVRTNHQRIALLYLKDRRKDKLSVPWGDGDTPVAEILRLLRDRKYPIRCYIDCDYKTTDRPADVQRSVEYAKAALV